jgi:hypothetical protein
LLPLFSPFSISFTLIIVFRFSFHILPLLLRYYAAATLFFFISLRHAIAMPPLAYATVSLIRFSPCFRHAFDAFAFAISISFFISLSILFSPLPFRHYAIDCHFAAFRHAADLCQPLADTPFDAAIFRLPFHADDAIFAIFIVVR